VQYVFSANVMVRVATRPAENPMGVVARKLSLGGGMARHAPRLSLPGKLVFPSHQNTGHFSMLGLGDIVMPGLLLCFVMRYCTGQCFGSGSAFDCLPWIRIQEV
jgi:signal peptide peptidase-like 3